MFRFRLAAPVALAVLLAMPAFSHQPGPPCDSQAEIARRLVAGGLIPTLTGTLEGFRLVIWTGAAAKVSLVVLTATSGKTCVVAGLNRAKGEGWISLPNEMGQ